MKQNTQIKLVKALDNLEYQIECMEANRKLNKKKQDLQAVSFCDGVIMGLAIGYKEIAKVLNIELPENIETILYE